MTVYLTTPSLAGHFDGAAAPEPVRLATVITRLEGGAGLLALRGTQAVMGPAVTPVIITGSAGRLGDVAAARGIDVVIEPTLREVIDLRDDLRATRRLEKIFRDYGADVVHTHCAKAGAVGRVAARRAGVRRIVHTFHGFPFHEFQSKARRRAYVSIERRLGRITDVALCVGTAVAAETIRRELVAPDRVRVIGVAVDGPERARASMSARLPEARRRARAALGLRADARVVGSVGRLTYQKAPEDFIAALADVGRDVTGVWVGSGDLAGRVSRHTRRLPEAGVVLAGERTDVLDVLPAFDVFASSSRYEGLPTALVEAMICGVPVVATAVNAVPDLVVPGETGLLVPPGRPGPLAGAIRHLLDSPALADRMAMTARARVGDQYGVAALRDALLSAYALGSPVDALVLNT